MNQDHCLDRINALTRNARNTWFALLAALVFVTITLMSVEHIDFYGVNRATQLPLVNVSVPTLYFFAAAPVLIAAIYGYLHLYLIRLWDALGAAPTQLNGIRLGDAVTPWLVTDAALGWRAYKRDDCSITPRALERSAMLLNPLLVWVSGILVLAALWWFSMPARTLWITGLAGLSLFVSLFAGAASLAAMLTRLRHLDQAREANIFAKAHSTFSLIFLVLVLFIAALSFERTTGLSHRLAPVNLFGEDIMVRPAGWLPYDIAKSEFFTLWCDRELQSENCDKLETKVAAFDAGFKSYSKLELADQIHPVWHKKGRHKPNFGGADLRKSFLAGANLTNAQLQHAILVGSQISWANLRDVQMQKANLRRAQMQGVNLTRAKMQETELTGAQLQGAKFNFSILTGSPKETNDLKKANLSKSANRGGALRFVDLSSAIFDSMTDFRNAFLDGSVALHQDFRTQMGNPCQWVNKVVEDDATFYGYWRGWVEANSSAPKSDKWNRIAPREYQNVTAIPPPEGCTWKTGPMPDTDTQ